MKQAPEFRGNSHRKLDAVYAWASHYSEAALEPELPIIDAHHHLWVSEQRGRYLVGDLAEDAASGHNIVATVFIETGIMSRADGPEAMRPVSEVEFAAGVATASAAGSNGKPHYCAGIVGRADLMLGGAVQPVLEAMMEAAGGRFRGVRHSVVWDSGNAAAFYHRKAPRYQLLDPVFRRGYSRLQPLGLSFDAWQFYPQLPDLADLLRAYPETRVILNHVGGPLGIPPHDANPEESFAVWRNNIRMVAQFPNLSCKIGGLGMIHCGWDFYLRDVPPSSDELAAAWRPYVETCIEAFGTARCMMESNFPIDKQSCGYGVLWNTLKRITQDYSPQEKLALYRDTAARVYRIPI